MRPRPRLDLAPNCFDLAPTSPRPRPDSLRPRTTSLDLATSSPRSPPDLAQASCSPAARPRRCRRPPAAALLLREPRRRVGGGAKLPPPPSPPPPTSSTSAARSPSSSCPSSSRPTSPSRCPFCSHGDRPLPSPNPPPPPFLRPRGSPAASASFITLPPPPSRPRLPTAGAHPRRDGGPRARATAPPPPPPPRQSSSSTRRPRPSSTPSPLCSSPPRRCPPPRRGGPRRRPRAPPRAPPERSSSRAAQGTSAPSCCRRRAARRAPSSRSCARPPRRRTRLRYVRQARAGQRRARAGTPRQAMPGDVGQQRFGLSEADALLACRTAVVHAAAEVNMLKRAADLAPTNVGGTCTRSLRGPRRRAARRRSSPSLSFALPERHRSRHRSRHRQPPSPPPRAGAPLLFTSTILPSGAPRPPATVVQGARRSSCAPRRAATTACRRPCTGPPPPPGPPHPRPAPCRWASHARACALPCCPGRCSWATSASASRRAARYPTTTMSCCCSRVHRPPPRAAPRGRSRSWRCPPNPRYPLISIAASPPHRMSCSPPSLAPQARLRVAPPRLVLDVPADEFTAAARGQGRPHLVEAPLAGAAVAPRPKTSPRSRRDPATLAPRAAPFCPASDLAASPAISRSSFPSSRRPPAASPPWTTRRPRAGYGARRLSQAHPDAARDGAGVRRRATPQLAGEGAFRDG